MYRELQGICMDGHKQFGCTLAIFVVGSNENYISLVTV